MKEWFKNNILRQPESNRPASIVEPSQVERYPRGAKGRKTYESRQPYRKSRTKVSPPYLGSRASEGTLQFIKMASETPVNSRERALWRNKGQKELGRRGKS